MNDILEKGKLLTQKELCAALGCGLYTVRELQKKGLPRVYLGNKTKGAGSRPRYSLRAVQDWLMSRAENAQLAGKEASV